MSRKLLEVLPSLQSFKDNVISPLSVMFNGAEWLNDATSYTKQETIYRLLVLKYGDRVIRYDDDNIFLNRLVFDLADLMPDIYAKQQVFIKNQLADFLSSVRNRAIIIDNETTNTRNSNSNSKLGNSSSPLNLVIDSAEQIQQAPITSSNLSNVKLVENYNGNNQQVNYNFVNDLVKTLNTDYSLRLNEFMELLGKHFVNIVGNYYRFNQYNNETIKDNPYQFNNGYIVNEVDYLGVENKEEIKRFNNKLEQLNTKIQTKQDQITAGENITITGNNVINAILPNVDFSNYYTKSYIDETVDKLYVEISDNRNDINVLDGDFKDIKDDLLDFEDKLNKNNNDINNINLKITSIENKQIGYDTLLEQKADKDNFSQSIKLSNVSFVNDNNNISVWKNNELVVQGNNQVTLLCKQSDNRIYVDGTNAYTKINGVKKVIASENFVNDALNTKQDILIAGNGITIEDNVISLNEPTQQINITTQETPIPNYFVNGKQVYAKYVEGTFKKNGWVELANNVDCFLENGVNISSSKYWDRYNIHGGYNGFEYNSNSYPNLYYKIYQDNSNNIQAYMNGSFQETFIFRGIIKYTKI